MKETSTKHGTFMSTSSTCSVQGGYVPEHWNEFVRESHRPAGPVGRAPAAWAHGLGLERIPNQESLPEHPLDRNQVREICRNPQHPVLFAYVVAMAWGGQGLGPTRRHAITAWEQRDRLQPILETLRAGGLTREQAYALFLKDGGIKGLGPSYFTKLMFFFRPMANSVPTGDGREHPVLDQWVGKSVNLLTGRIVVPLIGGVPSGKNEPRVYAEYCEVVDDIAHRLGIEAHEAEEKMMSRGGRKPGGWRQYVVEHWRN
jgi:hypothetical protein